MNEQKKDAALDEEALEGVTGGGDPWTEHLIDQAWAKIHKSESANDNKEEKS